MTKKTSSEDHATVEAGPQDKQPYATPSLQRYGPLFVETGKTSTCSDQHADNGATDYCDADGGPVDG
jgi:hypothetical protein